MFSPEPTKLKLHLSKDCESKIRTACKVFPNTEWSGAAFYQYIRKADETTNMEETELMIIDFTLQDIGTAGYTEYSLDKETAAYYAEHIDSLLGCKVCLLHSHHNLGAFFSSTDISTLKEQAAQCNNVLSLVVDNKGTYVAKFTERHKVHKDIAVTEDIATTDSWKYMGEKEDSNTKYSKEHSNRTNDYIEIKCWDCNIERPLDVSIDEDFKQECIDKINLFKHKKAEESKAKKILGFNDVSGMPRHYGIHWNIINDQENDEANVINTMTNSIFELSFKPSYSSYWYRDNLDDDISDEFYYAFMEAWCHYYDPNADLINKVIDEFKSRIDDKNYAAPLTAELILDYLKQIYNNLLKDEE